jgi:uncharacterized protein YigE (DUF2233 family)
MNKAVILALMVAPTLPFAGGQGMPAQAGSNPSFGPNACQQVTFERSRFTECVAMPSLHAIELRITGKNGVLYRGFSSLASDIRVENVAFAMNAGMYDGRSRPVGYYVEDGKKLYKLNRGTGQGNFYMQPNGVFFGTERDWKILPSAVYEKNVQNRPEFATQSGPMLLIDGTIHPTIAPDGASHYIRNAVGVDRFGRAHFVISDEPVSFGRMARFMRDRATTRNALYLDGAVSALWNPAIGRMDGRYPLGPLILVTRKQGAKPS